MERLRDSYARNLSLTLFDMKYPEVVLTGRYEIKDIAMKDCMIKRVSSFDFMSKSVRAFILSA